MPGPIRVDWQAIKNRWGPTVSEPHLFVLPKGFAQLVLAIQERLHWEATYRIEGYDFADWDELQTIVDNGLGGLTDSVNLTTLLNYLDEVEPLLRAIRDRPCCGDNAPIYNPDLDPNSGSTIEDGVGDPPTDYGSTPISTWQDWEDYKCEASWWAAENIALVLEGLADMGELAEQAPGSLTPEMIGEYLGAIPILGEVAQVLWAATLGLLDLTWDTFVDLDTAAGEVRAAAQDIACAIFNADGADAAADAMKTEVQAAVSGVLPGLVVAYLPYTLYANMVYEGEFVNRDGETVDLSEVLTPQTNDCSCALEFDFLYEQDFTGGLAGAWVLVNTTYDTTTCVTGSIRFGGTPGGNASRMDLDAADAYEETGGTHISGTDYYAKQVEIVLCWEQLAPGDVPPRLEVVTDAGSELFDLDVGTNTFIPTNNSSPLGHPVSLRLVGGSGTALGRITSAKVWFSLEQP